ncbi:MAG TPA: type VI secretion system-associated FHA domain protein TagH [Steroidobacteraceae bacterium]|nr:type VI secretion system-associated FHA domain protein TagH [Steroidobacteraceae bacterium]
MSLRLEIISAQREELGSRARLVVGEGGCSIGRALDNDWALPDALRFLSGRHACIHFRGGEYFLEDTSSNGTYVNESVAPLGRRGTRALLHSGDVLRMGDYRILVHIDEEAPAAATPAGPSLANSAGDITPRSDAAGRRGGADVIDFSALIRTADAGPALKDLGLVRVAGDGDLGDALNIEALLPERTTDSGTARATPARPAEQERTTATGRTRFDASGMAPDPRRALEAFCRGAGIDAANLPVQDETQAMHLAGRLLREALLGLKQILRAQQVFVDRNGIEREPPESGSPLDANMDEYLAELLLGHEKHRLDAVMRLREQFAHAGTHAAAVDPAMRSALQQFLGHLAPDRLAAADAATSWHRYREVYGSLLQARDGRLPHLFLEALAQAYQQAGARGAG